MTAVDARFTTKMMFTLTPDQHKLVKSFRTVDVSSAAILRACIEKLESDPELLQEVRSLASAEFERKPTSPDPLPVAKRVAEFYRRVSSDVDELDELRSTVSEFAARDRISRTAWIARNLLDSDEG
jgi:hypothetical protein